MKPADLAGLKTLLSDNRAWVGIGQIIGVAGVTQTRSTWRVKIRIEPDGRQVIARRGWADAAQGAGIFTAPRVGSMCVVVFPDGDSDMAIIVALLSSESDKIPENAVNGDTLLRSITTAKMRLESAQRILLARPDSEASENIVLGQVFKTAFSATLQSLMDLCDAIATHTHVGNLGASTSVPIQATDFSSDLKTEFQEIKSSPVDDELMLSEVSYTEKGAS